MPSDVVTLGAWWCVATATVVIVYAYLLYPLLLLLSTRQRARSPDRQIRQTDSWPALTITLPVYNEERAIARSLEGLLALDYPRDRLQVLVVSDASTDRTDEIVAGYAHAGVELVRLSSRVGKTAAENAGRAVASGEIIVNTDASVRVPSGSLKALVAAFADSGVGVASGRDVSVGSDSLETNAAEAGYVGYEMWVRSLETRVAGIVGSSGCFFACRADLHDADLPPALSWDFAAPLIAREKGYRAVSVPEASVFVPRTTSVRREYRRKVRTIARGMQTLRYKRRLLDPRKYGRFALMLWSHKVCRWVAPWFLTLGVAALALLGLRAPDLRWLLGGILAVVGLAAIGWLWPDGKVMPRVIAVPAFALAGNVAAMHAAIQAVRGSQTPIWEPTRRPSIGAEDPLALSAREPGDVASRPAVEGR